MRSIAIFFVCHVVLNVALNCFSIRALHVTDLQTDIFHVHAGFLLLCCFIHKRNIVERLELLLHRNTREVMGLSHRI